MKPAVGYLRVSTREQGRSGLGSQRNARTSKPSGRAKVSPSTPGIRMFRPAPERMRCYCDRVLRPR